MGLKIKSFFIMVERCDDQLLDFSRGKFILKILSDSRKLQH